MSSFRSNTRTNRGRGSWAAPLGGSRSSSFHNWNETFHPDFYQQSSAPAATAPSSGGRGRNAPSPTTNNVVGDPTGTATLGQSRPYVAPKFPTPAPQLPKDLDIMGGLRKKTTPIKTLSKPVVSFPLEPVPLTNVRYLGSYNWVESSDGQPTIIVPGSPRQWLEPHTMGLPFQLPADRGVQFVDQNLHRVPSSPMLPLFRAVDDVLLQQRQEVADTAGTGVARAEGTHVIDREVDWAGVDFVTDRNGLRKLLRWINHYGSQQIADFRIDLELLGKKTVLLCRWEKRTRDASFGWTYGYAFEKKTTKAVEGVEESTGHHRIIKYDMDGLDMVVRFEVDAFHPLPDTRPTPAARRRSTAMATSATAATTAGRDRANVDELSGLFTSLRVSSTPANPKAAPTSSTPITPLTPSLVTNESKSKSKSKSESKASSPTVRIVRAGRRVLQSEVMEVMTRSMRNAISIDWRESYPQLWLSQTRWHAVGVHEKGVFSHIDIRTPESPELKQANHDNQLVFRKLRSFLKEIQDLAVTHGKEGRLSLVCRDGVMEVYERRDNRSMLPEDVLRRFE